MAMTVRPERKLNINGIIKKLHETHFISYDTWDLNRRIRGNIEKIEFRTPYEIPKISDFIRNAEHITYNVIEDIFVNGSTGEIPNREVPPVKSGDIVLDDSGITVKRKRFKKGVIKKKVIHSLDFSVDLEKIDSEVIKDKKPIFDALDKYKNDLNIKYVDEDDYLAIGIRNSPYHSFGGIFFWGYMECTPTISIKDSKLDKILGPFFYSL